MPELPDITVYVERLAARASSQVLRQVRVLNPFVLRTALPPVASVEGKRLLGVERLGKRVVLELEGDLFLVMHLMIAGRLRWLAPVALSRALDDAGVQRLFEATRSVLAEWTERLRAEALQTGWPDKVTAFRPEMAVHGRFWQPCPLCAAPVQRIVQGGAPKLTSFAAPRRGAAALGASRRVAGNETNYCARCQMGGKLLADRALSKLLKAKWPKSIDDL